MMQDGAVLPRGRGRLLLALVALAALCVSQGADAQTRFMYLTRISDLVVVPYR